MQATELLREQVKQVHQYVEGIMADVPPELAHWHPPGTIVNSLGGNYAHIIVAEDLVINAILKGVAPLFPQTGVAKHEQPTFQQLPAPQTPVFPPRKEWSTNGHMALTPVRPSEPAH